jgi:hypothetical protein
MGDEVSILWVGAKREGSASNRAKRVNIGEAMTKECSYMPFVTR